MLRRIIAGCIAAAIIAPGAAAQFVPGRVFVSDPANDFCSHTDDWGLPFAFEHIYEIDPLTGEFHLFATIPREWCGWTTGMAFSPDGKRLRVSSLLNSAIFEFDAQGNRSVALDFSDGIRAPEGCNNIAFDRDGNFYIPAKSATAGVLKFPADGGPAVPLGGPIGRPLSLAVSRTGDIFVTSYPNLTGSDNKIVRITQTGVSSDFDIFFGFNEVPNPITIDDFENVFVRVTSSPTTVYLYPNGIAKHREVVATCDFGLPEICSIGTLAMAADDSRLYSLSWAPTLRLIAINLDEDTYDALAVSPPGVFPSSCGMAVVPLRGDFNNFGGVDLLDYGMFEACLSGPDVQKLSSVCSDVDLDTDGDVDLFDFRFFQWAFGRKD